MDILLRRSYVSLALPGNLAVAAGVAGFVAEFPANIVKAQLYLGSTGTGAGSTTVTVKKNGTAILPAAGLTIAGAAAGKTAESATTKPEGLPGGVRIDVGDVITVDVSAIPGTTASANGEVKLHIVQSDI